MGSHWSVMGNAWSYLLFDKGLPGCSEEWMSNCGESSYKSLVLAHMRYREMHQSESVSEGKISTRLVMDWVWVTKDRKMVGMTPRFSLSKTKEERNSLWCQNSNRTSKQWLSVHQYTHLKKGNPQFIDSFLCEDIVLNFLTHSNVLMYLIPQKGLWSVI